MTHTRWISFTVSLESKILPIKKGTFPSGSLNNGLNPLIIRRTKLLIIGSSRSVEMPGEWFPSSCHHTLSTVQLQQWEWKFGTFLWHAWFKLTQLVCISVWFTYMMTACHSAYFERQVGVKQSGMTPSLRASANHLPQCLGALAPVYPGRQNVTALLRSIPSSSFFKNSICLPAAFPPSRPTSH